MKIQKNILPESIIEFVIEENLKETEKYRKKALIYIEENSDIKGFRKWSYVSYWKIRYEYILYRLFDL